MNVFQLVTLSNTLPSTLRRIKLPNLSFISTLSDVTSATSLPFYQLPLAAAAKLNATKSNISFHCFHTDVEYVFEN